METLPAWCSSNVWHPLLAVICSRPTSMVRSAATRVLRLIGQSSLRVTGRTPGVLCLRRTRNKAAKNPWAPRSQYSPTTYAPPRHSAGTEAPTKVLRDHCPNAGDAEHDRNQRPNVSGPICLANEPIVGRSRIPHIGKRGDGQSSGWLECIVSILVRAYTNRGPQICSVSTKRRNY